MPGTTVTKMGVSGDGVQQFLDRLVDEALSTVDLPETTSSRPRSASAATAWVAVRQMIGRYAPSATDERSPRLSGRTEFADQCVGTDDADAGVGLGVGDADRCGTHQGGLMRSSWRRNSLGALTMSPRNWSVQRMLQGVSAARGLAAGGLPL